MAETRRIADAVLVLTDVVDSTRLTARLGDEAMERVWRRHDEAARALLARYHGIEVDRTDGFLLLFERVDDALGWATAFHGALAELSAELGVAVVARAGVHVGPALLLENRAEDRARGAKALELEGLAKPVAARVMSAAPGGGTLVSAAAVARSGGGAAAAVSCGFWHMKGVDEPIEIFGLPGPDGAVRPPVDGEKVWRLVQGPDGWRPARDIPSRLPAPRDAFVGRDPELRALSAAIEGGARAVTLVGPGGSGKSRLAVHYAWRTLGDWPGGAWTCDLAGARDAEAVMAAVAEALGVPLGREPAEAQLGRVLDALGRCLLVLDGAEAATEAVCGLLDAWLDRAGQAVFLVTSRARLRLQGERVLTVGPMSAEAGAALFRARAAAHGAELPGAEVDADIAAVVAQVDRLPLAIELAAARARALSPSRIAARLADRLGTLVGGRGRARHATLRATIDWSWELLDPPLRAALAQLSVFEGGFTVEAAEAVLDLSGWPDAPSVWEILDALEDQSLLQRLDRQSWRLGLLGVIQAYAAEKLLSESDLPGVGPAAAQAAQIRHGRYFAGLGGPRLTERLHGPDGVAVRDRLGPELPNLDAAITRAVARQDARVAVDALGVAWAVLNFRGPFQRALALAEAVAGLPLAPVDRARTLERCASARLELGGALLARGALEEAAALLRAEGAKDELCACLGDLGVVVGFGGDLEAGMALVQEGAQLARQLGRTRDVAANLVRLGNLQDLGGDLDAARVTYQEALPLAVAAGDRATEGIVSSNLGRVHMHQGRLDLAEVGLRRALAVAREIRAPKSECVATLNLGALLVELGQRDEAERCFREATQIALRIGDRREEQICACNLALVEVGRGDVDAALASLRQALALAADSGLPHMQMAAHEVASQVYRAARQPTAAAEHVRAWLEVARRAGRPADVAAAEAALRACLEA